MADQYIIPCPTGDDFVELARDRRVQGRLFRKHILTQGDLIHPKTGQHISIDGQFVSRLRRNFSDGVCDIVQVPVADAANKHTETPLANIGEVVGLEEDAGKVYALIDARDPEAAGKLGKTLLGASAFLSTDYTDTRTGEKAGPTLLHVAVTNRPYVTGLEDYEEVVAATADNSEDEAVILTPAEEQAMTKDEMLEALKAEHGIDVAALQETAGSGADAAQLTAALRDALGQSSVQLSGGDTGITGEDIVGAIGELAQLTRTQSEQIGGLQRERAAAEVECYVTEGRVLPKQRAAFTELALTNRDLLEELLPDKPVVALAQQAGVTPDRPEGQERDIDAELAELTARHSRFFGGKQSG